MPIDNPRIYLEICVDSIESVLNACHGGADRLELCSALSEGGLTPTSSFLKLSKKVSTIPIFCMVRPRGGSMFFSAFERELILEEARALREAGADGLVFGALTKEGIVDEQLCTDFIKVANGLPCTFHRAFDLLHDPIRGFDTVAALGFSRILTSGCKPSALEGRSLIKQLVERGNGHKISVMAGAGIKASNCLQLITDTGVTEVHGSARIQRTSADRENSSDVRMGNAFYGEGFVTSCNEVRAMRVVLDG